MVNLIADFPAFLKILHMDTPWDGEHLVLVFICVLCYGVFFTIIVLTLVSFFSFIFSLLRKVLLRYRNKKIN